MKIMRTILNELKLRYRWNVELNLPNRHLETPVSNLGSIFRLEIDSTLGIEVPIEAVRINKSSKEWRQWWFQTHNAWSWSGQVPAPGVSSQSLSDHFQTQCPLPCMRTATPCTLASTQGGSGQPFALPDISPAYPAYPQPGYSHPAG